MAEPSAALVEEEVRAWERLCELIWGCAIGQAIHVAVELRIPELLATGPQTIDQLAKATGADAWGIETVVRALAAHDILSTGDDQLYALTRMGKLLLNSAPGPSAGEAGVFFETIYRPLGALLHMVRTGDVAFNHVFGKSFYDHLADSPALAAHFYGTMEGNAAQRYRDLSSVCDFSAVTRVIDVGGGVGSLLVQILSQHQEAKGVLFELSLVSERARDRIRAAGLADRCEVVSGDFFAGVPGGGDLYILANVLNNWRDDEARRILANCRASMGVGGRILVLEATSDVVQLSRWRSLVSLGVMAQRGGRTRSAAQLRFLLGSAGLCVEEILQLPANVTTAIKAKPIA